jgi:hypothetical protein
VQFPFAAKDTGRPELEKAETTKSGSPNVFVSSGGKKVIDWRTLAMVNVRETSGAGLKFRPPGCDAVTVQEPPLVMYTTPPKKKQEPLALKETGKPEDAVAWGAKAGSPYVLSAIGSNVIVWSRRSASARL